MATSDQIAALIAYRGGQSGRDDAFAGACYDQGAALVDQWIGDNTAEVPDAIRTGAILECASKVWLRKSAPAGQDSYMDPESGYTPIPKDPMVTARPILDPFLPGGFA